MVGNLTTNNYKQKYLSVSLLHPENLKYLPKLNFFAYFFDLRLLIKNTQTNKSITDVRPFYNAQSARERERETK